MSTIDVVLDEALVHLGKLAEFKDEIAVLRASGNPRSLLPPNISIIASTIEKLLESQVHLKTSKMWKDALWDIMPKLEGEDVRMRKGKEDIKEICENFKEHKQVLACETRMKHIENVASLFLTFEGEGEGGYEDFLASQSLDAFCSLVKAPQLLIRAKGVGPTTLQVVAIMGRRDANVLPLSKFDKKSGKWKDGDSLVQKFVETHAELKDLGEGLVKRWSPYSSVASLLIWRKKAREVEEKAREVEKKAREVEEKDEEKAKKMKKKRTSGDANEEGGGEVPKKKMKTK